MYTYYDIGAGGARCPFSELTGSVHTILHLHST